MAWKISVRIQRLRAGGRVFAQHLRACPLAGIWNIRAIASAALSGEEFAVVLPNTSLAEALNRAEAMRAAFDSNSSPNTVSVGVASEVPGPSREPLQLLRDADDALYTAKRAGRNRVMAAAA